MNRGRRIHRRVSPHHIVPCKECAHPEPPSGPGTSILDTIPEAKALYCPHRILRKRKSSVEEASDWKRYRETKQVIESNAASSDEDEDKGLPLQDEDSEDEDSLYKFPKFSPSKFYHSVVHEIDELMKDFRLTDETYEKIKKLLNEEMDRGLGKNTHDTATVKMFPTYVQHITDGSEHGEFLALDLGGTNFRVLHVKLEGKKAPEVKGQTFLIPKVIMLGSGRQLFNHIADCIKKFLNAEGLNGRSWPLGFTFSFPCVQDGLASARLVRWTKGFRCEGVQGEDVVKLLHEALQRKQEDGTFNKGTQVHCVALINDPVGALMSTAHGDNSCLIGLILGTGTNACYMENLDKVGTWNGPKDGPQQVAINTEWGAFGDNGVLKFVRNSFDTEVDEDSLNPGHQLFEKMISGMYMGEIVRLILCQLVLSGLLFGGEGSDELCDKGNFLTKYISEIESDDSSGNFENTKLILQELDINHFTIDDCRHVQHVCWQVSQRAAFLAGTAVACLINRLDKSTVTVGVDGSLYKFHPHFSDLMQRKISQLVRPDQKFKLMTSHDGSGTGAALVAAVAYCARRKDGDDNNTEPAS